VYFLRKVVWTVPDFEVPRYEAELRRLHEQMPFVSYAHRYLIEARKSGASQRDAPLRATRTGRAVPSRLWQTISDPCCGDGSRS
jgi:hypothetical protein